MAPETDATKLSRQERLLRTIVHNFPPELGAPGYDEQNLQVIDTERLLQSWNGYDVIYNDFKKDNENVSNR